ncbi:MAG: hypothetical protein KGQ41_00990 [Alphaproteobacteria bacterium]|nr:hypothetical protein [Alphaproteobacteria bacterium]
MKITMQKMVEPQTPKKGRIKSLLEWLFWPEEGRDDVRKWAGILKTTVSNANSREYRRTFWRELVDYYYSPFRKPQYPARYPVSGLVWALKNVFYLPAALTYAALYNPRMKVLGAALTTGLMWVDVAVFHKIEGTWNFFARELAALRDRPIPWHKEKSATFGLLRLAAIKFRDRHDIAKRHRGWSAGLLGVSVLGAATLFLGLKLPFFMANLSWIGLGAAGLAGAYATYKAAKWSASTKAGKATLGTLSKIAQNKSLRRTLGVGLKSVLSFGILMALTSLAVPATLAAAYGVHVGIRKVALRNIRKHGDAARKSWRYLYIAKNVSELVRHTLKLPIALPVILFDRIIHPAHGAIEKVYHGMDSYPFTRRIIKYGSKTTLAWPMFAAAWFGVSYLMSPLAHDALHLFEVGTNILKPAWAGDFDKIAEQFYLKGATSAEDFPQFLRSVKRSAWFSIWQGLGAAISIKLGMTLIGGKLHDIARPNMREKSPTLRVIDDATTYTINYAYSLGSNFSKSFSTTLKALRDLMDGTLVITKEMQAEMLNLPKSIPIKVTPPKVKLGLFRRRNAQPAATQAAEGPASVAVTEVKASEPALAEAQQTVQGGFQSHLKGRVVKVTPRPSFKMAAGYKASNPPGLAQAWMRARIEPRRWRNIKKVPRPKAAI